MICQLFGLQVSSEASLKIGEDISSQWLVDSYLAGRLLDLAQYTATSYQQDEDILMSEPLVPLSVQQVISQTPPSFMDALRQLDIHSVKAPAIVQHQPVYKLLISKGKSSQKQID